MKKLRIILAVIVAIVLSLGICLLYHLGDETSDCYGKWIWKYTYTDNDKLKYTEEDGMEIYSEFQTDGRYREADYCDDVELNGIWLEFKDRIVVLGPWEVFTKQENGSLKTSVKKEANGFPAHYNVLIREEQDEE